ncbi:MAG: hypothetical protein K2K10_09460 [Acetatifactor sp.]|nr:hypothetical protein [Acetatifactor sp.]
MVRALFGKKMDDRGSALLTVVLVVGFLTILATTLLYISGMNFQIKQADYQNKKSFYTGETGLEEIRAHLMEDASEAAARAYNNVPMRFVTTGTKDFRQLEFNNEFVAQLQEIWNNKLAMEGNNWRNLIRNYYTNGTDPSSPYTMRLDPNDIYDSNHDGVLDSSELLEVHDADGYIRIRGMRMTYTNPDNGRTTIITTDMDVYAPNLDWSAEGTSKELAAGVTAEMAARRTTVDVSKCVRYANWKKE